MSTLALLREYCHFVVTRSWILAVVFDNANFDRTLPHPLPQYRAA